MRTRKLSKREQQFQDYFRHQFERAFRLYDTPAMPGGSVDDIGIFPMAYGRYLPPVQDLDALFTPEQRAFNATIAHKGMAQITDADRAAAAKVGMTLCDFKIRPAGRQPWGPGTVRR